MTRDCSLRVRFLLLTTTVLCALLSYFSAVASLKFDSFEFCEKVIDESLLNLTPPVSQSWHLSWLGFFGKKKTLIFWGKPEK